MKASNLNIDRFFRVMVDWRSYVKMLYLFLSFPLGLAYFIVLIVGLATGFGLLIIWVGLLILMLVFAIWWGLLMFERQMAVWMLGEEIPPMSPPVPEGVNLWERFKGILTNSVTWKGLVYLFAKFPLGLLSFIVVVVLLSLTVGFLSAPLFYEYVTIDFGFWIVDSMSDAALIAIAGLLLWPISLHVFNGLAFISGRFARVMLGDVRFRRDGESLRDEAEVDPQDQIGLEEQSSE